MFTIHRVLGTLLSVLFLMWFVSGIVMIYHGFPSAGRDEKAAKLEPLDTDLPSVDELARRLPDTSTNCRSAVISDRPFTRFAAAKKRSVCRPTAPSNCRLSTEHISLV